MTTTPLTEDEFIERARQFLGGRTGRPPASIDSNADLVGSGVIDSLLLVDFFFFLEELVGAEITVDDDGVKELASLSGAYRHYRRQALH